MTLIWITGYPGAGKTTTALKLKEVLKEEHKFVLHLDGDDLRDCLCNYNYTLSSRKMLAMSYSRLATMLSKQVDHVVVSTFSFFPEVYKNNRENSDSYLEVLLKPPKKRLMKSRPNIFRGNETTDLFPKLIPPQSPHILIDEDPYPDCAAIVQEICRHVA